MPSLRRATALLVLMLALTSSMMVIPGIRPVHAGNGFYDLPAQTGYVTDSGRGINVGIYGTSSEYAHNGPDCCDLHPQFYAGIESKAHDPINTNDIFGITDLHITATATDPNGGAVSGAYFTARDVRLSPESNPSDAQSVLTFIYNAMLNALPWGIGSDIQYATSNAGGLSNGNPGNTGYANWTDCNWLGCPLGESYHGLWFGFQMQIGTGLQGTYSVRIQYHVEIHECFGFAQLKCNNGTGTITQDLYDTMYYCYVVCNPDVSVGDYSGSLSLTAGGTAVTDSIVVSANNYFGPPNPVSVSATSNDPSIGLSVNPQAVNLQRSRPDSPYANGFTTLTVTLAAGACKTGTFTITVVAQDNGLFASHGIPVTEPCDFSITATPGSVTIGGSNSGTSTITVSPLYGFSGSVTLSSSVSPSTGLSCNLSTTSITTSGTSTLSCSGTTPGTYTVTVTGTSGSLIHSTNVYFTTGDFSISANPTSINVNPGTFGTSTISVGSLNSFSGNVALSTSPPAGFFATLNPTTVSLSSGGTAASTLAVSVSGAPSAGTYTIPVTGTSGAISHTVNLVVTVNGNRLTNPGFESGDFTGWLQTGMNIRADARNVHSGSFAAAPIYNPSTQIYSAFTLEQDLATPVAGAYVTSIQLWYLYGDCCDSAQVLYTDGSSTQTNLPQVLSWTLKTLNYDSTKQITGIKVSRPSGQYNIIDLDDFQLTITTHTLSNTPSSSDWTGQSGTWTVVNGYMDGSGTSAQIQSGASFPSDRTVSVRAKTITSGGTPWKTAFLYGKYVDFYDKLYMYIQTDGTIVLAMWQGSTNHGYVYYNSGLSTYDWHVFTMVISGNTAKAYVDGTLYITATDPIIGALGAAPVGLASWGPSESQFDSVTIS